MTPQAGADSTAPRRRTDARRNRERLLAAAREVFAEAGPEASLNEIARRAGVGPGTLYRHFPSRPALLTAVLEDRIERLCLLGERLLSADSADSSDSSDSAESSGPAGSAEFADPADPADPAELLEAPESVGPAGSADEALAQWLRAFLVHARVNRGMGSALLVGEAGEPGGLDCHRPILEAAAGLLDRAQEQGVARPDLTADDLVQLVVGIALSTARGADAEQPERLLALVLDAVRVAPHGSA